MFELLLWGVPLFFGALTVLALAYTIWNQVHRVKLVREWSEDPEKAYEKSTGKKARPTRGPGGPPRLTLLAHWDPSFSEEAFWEEVRRLATAGFQGHLDRPELRALPLARSLRFGPVRLLSAYADELWADVEVEIQAELEETDARSWRVDRWRLRRKRGEPWTVSVIAATERHTLPPRPPERPLDEELRKIGPAPECEESWDELRDHLPSLEVLQQEARALGQRLLEGDRGACTPRLAEALDYVGVAAPTITELRPGGLFAVHADAAHLRVHLAVMVVTAERGSWPLLLHLQRARTGGAWTVAWLWWLSPEGEA